MGDSDQPDEPTGFQIDPLKFHRRVAVVAESRRYLTVEEMADALVEVSQHPEMDPQKFWVSSGRLDRTEYSEIAQHIYEDVQSNRGATSLMRRTGVQISKDGSLLTRDENNSEAQNVNLADVLKTSDYERLQSSSRVSERVPEADESETAGEAGRSGGGRYILGEELGRGGVGRVIRAFDRDLGRVVAMKLPLEPDLDKEQLARFVEEAQATGQLEHPNIIPIYDIGMLETGEIFYTMKRVRDQSLRSVINSLRAQDPKVTEQYGRHRLLNVFQQVCRAITYAHARGVIHRDLKPENIMLGTYGEVHVTDWGLAQVLARDVVTQRSLRSMNSQPSGHAVGTPAYMPPEQARGKLEDVDERSDVYSLGVILYEILSLRQPSTRSSVMETLMAVLNDPILPPGKVSPDRGIPPELDDIVMHALATNKDARWQSASELHDAVERYLEGKSFRAADEHFASAKEWVHEYLSARAAIDASRKTISRLVAQTKPWDSAASKQALWHVEDEAERQVIRRVRAYEGASTEFGRVFAQRADHEEALALYCELLWREYVRSVEEDDQPAIAWFHALLRRHDHSRRYLRRLDEKAWLDVATNTEGARVFVERLDTVERIDRSIDTVFAGTTPIENHPLDRGRYILSVSAPGYATVRIPLDVQFSGNLKRHVDLTPLSRAPEEFEYVCGGPTMLSSDASVSSAPSVRRVHLEPFWLQRLPVTFRAYTQFLNEMGRIDPSRLPDLLPCRPDTGEELVRRHTDASYVPVPEALSDNSTAVQPWPDEAVWSLPIVGVSTSSMEEFAMWRGARDDMDYRLPTESEWEFAVRGVDRRHYPWGDHFDPSFCRMRLSRAAASFIEPVGIFGVDRSVFGIHDLAGGVSEACTAGYGASRTWVARGGNWASDASSCRANARIRLTGDTRSMTLGFRLAASAQARVRFSNDMHPNSLDDRMPTGPESIRNLRSQVFGETE